MEKPSIEQETLFKQHLALCEKPSTEKEIIFKESLTLQEKPIIEKETLFKEPLALQMSTINEAFLFKDTTALNEKPTTAKELSFKEPLALQDWNQPYVSSTVPESITGKSSIATITSVGKSSTTTKSSACKSASNKPFSLQGTPKKITPQEDIDEDSSDASFNSVYAKEIFSYTKQREVQFILTDYMNRQIEITSNMRAVLVDWLVEVQVSFEMTRKTLYLAVKLVNFYLMKVVCGKYKLQLLGATTLMIAAKSEEPSLPRVDDFVYICDDN
ncbi:G2/mitotic-specific cyclin-B3 [Plecturocebus cupreus]